MSKTELRVLSAGAVKRGVAQVAKEFERATGTRVNVEFDTAPEMRKRVAAGETADVIVAPPAVMDEFAKQGKIAADSRGFVGRSRMGVVVHAKAAAPGSRRHGGLQARAARRDRGRAQQGLQRHLRRKAAGKARADRRRWARRSSSWTPARRSWRPSRRKGRGAIGLAQISEVMVMIDKGCAVKLAAPLPDEIQNVTSYDAAATSRARRRTPRASWPASLDLRCGKESLRRNRHQLAGASRRDR